MSLWQGLGAQPRTPLCPDPDADDRIEGSTQEDIRNLLAWQGGMTECELAQALGQQAGMVVALMRRDLALGRIYRYRHRYYLHKEK